MKQICAIAVIITLLGGCSDLNPFGSDRSTADSKVPADAAKAPAAKRVVIARLADVPKADPAALDKIAPAARTDPAARNDEEPDPEPVADATPKADEDFVNYLAGKKTVTRRAARAAKPAAAKKASAVNPNHFELDKIAPGAGPGRKSGQIDDAYSADRDFINALTTDTKPARKRTRGPVKRKRVTLKPSPRKRVAPKRSETRVIRISPKPATKPATRPATKPAAAKRAAPRQARAARARPAAQRDKRALATLEGADAADKEVLKALGGQ